MGGLGRRAFFRRLLAGSAGAAIGAELDIERLLWVPKPIITVPAMPGFITPEWVTRDALREIDRMFAAAALVDRCYADPAFLVGRVVTARGLTS